MKLAQWIFRVAGIYGLMVTVPLVFAEGMMGVKQPEFYYGFVFLNICWQIVYLYISSDPIRYRPMTLPAVLVKVTGATAIAWLMVQGRIPGQWIVAAAVDAGFAALFLVAFWATRREALGQPT